MSGQGGGRGWVAGNGSGRGGGGDGGGGGGNSGKRRRRGGRGGRGAGGNGAGVNNGAPARDGNGGGGRDGGNGQYRPPRNGMDAACHGQPPAAGGMQQQQQNGGYGGGAAPPMPPVPPTRQHAKSNPNSRTSSTTMSQMTVTKFAELPLSAPTQRGIAEVLGYETMTKVQHQAIPPALTGQDVLAKAKTGTGKTLSFLLPAIEGVARTPRPQRRGISVLIISPTRELAQQIAEEANQVLTFHDMGLQCVVGGTNINKDFQRFSAKPGPDILVATPGRLNDHLDNHGLAPAMQGIAHLIFDEADQLLEMGFRPAIEAILRYLPDRQSRQTLLFSATMPPDVEKIARLALKNVYEYVDCVGEEESTHEHVPQQFVVCRQETQAQELCQLLRENIAADPAGHKIIVFFTTARLTQFYAELCNLMGFPVLEIHSRKSQGHRNKVSDLFRNGQGLVMFTSDVSARGMDYPDVSAVLQVGLPSDKAQYIHRLGRTARAGKGGHGILVLCDFESTFLSEVRDLPMQKRESMPETAVAGLTPSVDAAMDRMDHTSIVCAYQAWLGFYNGQLRRVRWSKEDLVSMANFWITTVCRQQVPGLQAKTLGKMGLRGVAGIVEERNAPGGGGRNGGGRGGGRGGVGGGVGVEVEVEEGAGEEGAEEGGGGGRSARRRGWGMGGGGGGRGGVATIERPSVFLE